MGVLNFPARVLFSAVCLGFVIAGCKQKKIILKSPPHYNFGEVWETKLDNRIKEISGLAWETKKNEFIAHNDESGKLFFLEMTTKGIRSELAFAGKGDYEDISLVNGVPYILRSDGVITKVVIDSTNKAQGEEVGKLQIDGDRDFEAMYYDSSRKALVILCKNCEIDNKKVVSAFAYHIDSGFSSTPVYTIDIAAVEKMTPRETSRFQPSAAAIHPVLNKLFILSSASNQLVITDLDGHVEGVYALAKKLFPQAEGITFRSSGEMYISNEGVNSRATILRFMYR